MTVHDVLGQRVEMPVRIRRATAFMALYSVPTAAAQRLIDHTGLELLRFRPGRSLCGLVFVDYVDGDLGPYNEFGVTFMVRDHRIRGSSVRGDLGALARGRSGTLIHHLPVDGAFTLAAGRGIWGFPKVLADFDTDHASDVKHGSLSQDGTLIADLTLRPGLRLPRAASARTTLAAYSHLGGVTRRTDWEMNPSGVRARTGGAELVLGTHPIADELRSLGLPRRALATMSIPDLQMTFGDATAVD